MTDDTRAVDGATGEPDDVPEFFDLPFEQWYEDEDEIDWRGFDADEYSELNLDDWMRLRDPSHAASERERARDAESETR